jgi:ribulose-phosphate 3-epimerase
VALNPSTPPEVVQYVLDDVDLILVMSVNPGFGGQKFIPSAYAKLERLRDMVGRRPIEVSVDGGVKVEHAKPLRDHGATVLVAGSAIFGAPDPAAVIRAMRTAAGS